MSTYKGRGLAARGKQKAEHVLVYSGKRVPALTDAEAPQGDEKGLLEPPIRVDPDDREEKLDVMTRLNVGKMHTIEHNVKVRRDRKSTRLNSSHSGESRMPSSA